MATEDWWITTRDHMIEINEVVFGERERCAQLAEQAGQMDLAVQIRKGNLLFHPPGKVAQESL